MTNFMTGFMQGYDFVDEKKRLDRNEARFEEDRTRALTRQQRMDERSDDLWKRQTKALDDQESLRGLQSEAYEIDTLLERVMAGDQVAQQQAQELAAGDTRIQAFNQMLQDPQALEQTALDLDVLEAGFKGQAQSKGQILEAANRVLAPYINYGDGGENKRIVDILPSQSGKGFYVELEMEENGKTKRAPLTGPNRSAKDTEVKEIPADKLAQALMAIKRDINSRRVALGDQAPLQARTATEQYRLTRADKAEDRAAAHQLAVELENIKQGNRVLIEGMKRDAEASGIGTKEFNTALNSLEGLLKKRVQILVGSDEFGNVMPQENIDKALKEIDFAIADRERYLTSIAPGLWEKYRPQLQDGGQRGPTPGQRPALDDIFGGGAQQQPQGAVPAQVSQNPSNQIPRNAPPAPGTTAGQGQQQPPVDPWGEGRADLLTPSLKPDEPFKGMLEAANPSEKIQKQQADKIFSALKGVDGNEQLRRVEILRREQRYPDKVLQLVIEKITASN